MIVNNIEFTRINKNGATSKYYVSNDKQYFMKQIIKYTNYEILKREVYILKLLNKHNFDWCPKFVFTNDKDIIITEWIGEVVNKNNIPDGFTQQSKKILSDLSSLNIRHNDIKHGEILIKENKIFLVDFGWASFGDDFSLGGMCDNKIKPCGIFNDKNIIYILDKIYKTKMSEKVKTYKDPKRKVGNQSEVPHIKIDGDITKVTGYQKYHISKDGINYFSKQKKYNVVKSILTKLKNESECNSLCDIGCSGGIVGFIAHFLKYESILGLDHDPEYLGVINKVCEHHSIINYKTRKFSFGDKLEKSDALCAEQSDVVVMCALIHWIFSCTAHFGSFEKIFTYIKPLVKKYLLIEWVGVNDGAIRSFKHTSHNKSVHQEEYCKENFEKGLKIIGEIESVTLVDGGSRFLYVVKVC